MKWLLRSPGKAAATAALLVVAGILLAGGGEMFSPGPLNADNRHDSRRGGVRSHAEIAGHCSACHAPPWSGVSMADRCLDCHGEVRQQMRDRLPLHGTLSPGVTCKNCHSEHNGAHAPPTRLDQFDHDCTAFRLTGAHQTVACAACHADNRFKGTPRTCVGCHAEPPVPRVHKVGYGSNCAGCHTTMSFTGATFRHTFPLNHGARGPKNPNTCATCHPATGNYILYTCYNCHRHDPLKTEQQHARRGIFDFQDCAKCHASGRKKEKGGRERAALSDPGNLLPSWPGSCCLWDPIGRTE